MRNENSDVNKAVGYWLIGNSEPILSIVDDLSLSPNDLIYIVKSVGFIEVSGSEKSEDGIDIVIKALKNLSTEEFKDRLTLSGHLDRFFLFSHRYEELYDLMNQKIQPLLFKTGERYIDNLYFKMLSSIDLTTKMSLKKSFFSLCDWAKSNSNTGENLCQFYINIMKLLSFSDCKPMREFDKSFNRLDYADDLSTDLNFSKKMYSFLESIKADGDFLKFVEKSSNAMNLDMLLVKKGEEFTRMNKI